VKTGCTRVGARLLAASVLGAVVLGAEIPGSSGFGASAAAAQEHIENARTEHRPFAQTLQREIDGLAARATTTWIGYRLPAIPTSRFSCNAPVQLEPPKEMIVLVRVSGNAVDRLRTFAPSCAIDAGEMPMIWFDGVTPDASATWLASVARKAAESGERNPPLLQSAMSALDVTPGPVALRSLIAFAKDDARSVVRSRAISSLAFRAEAEAGATIQNAIANDPDTEVKKAAVGALARMPKDEGVPLLIQVARTNRNVDVRRQAMNLLGQSKDARAVSFFEEILTK
jgi:hypothetical protein